MRFFHLADLHIGKVVNGFSMLDDQRYIISQILLHIKEQRPDAIVIAGDVYDKPVPSGGAVQLYDDFLTELVVLKVPAFIISGNHDSPERLDFAGRIMRSQNLYIYGLFDGTLHCCTLEDQYGPVDFYLLPFIKPAVVRNRYPDCNIDSYDDAIRVIMEHTELNENRRNVLIAHQFVIGTNATPLRSESEINPVGGIDSVNAGFFSPFDYVALGHLHIPQQIGRETVRYAGSPLKYSFSECGRRDPKSISVVDMQEKGSVTIQTIPLQPLHDMRKIAGPMEELTAQEIVQSGDPNDYLHVTLTDPNEVMDAMAKLRRCYPNIMELSYDHNKRAQVPLGLSEETAVENKTPYQLFEDFYQEQNGELPDETLQSYAQGFFNETGDCI